MWTLYLVLHGERFIAKKDLFVLTFNINSWVYNIWYLERFRLPKIFDKNLTGRLAKFKWKILMSKGSDIVDKRYKP